MRNFPHASLFMVWIVLWVIPETARAQAGLSGLSGFWNAPSAELFRDGKVELGYNIIPKEWAYDSRGEFRNDVYFATLGFLPRIEISARVTVLPGSRIFTDLDPGSRLTDADRMMSGKLLLLEQKGSIPDLALGIEDPFGTRRFHTAYLVAGREFRRNRTRARVDVGYASPVLRTRAHTIRGGFGGADVSPLKPLSVVLEYDTEKWNLGIKARGPFGLTAKVAWLDLRRISGGASLRVTL